MNILLINHYAGSNMHGMEYRPFCLAKEWVKLGHQVSIIAASYSHLRSKNPDVGGKITKEFIEGIQYLWIKTPHYQGNGIRRVINMLAFSAILILEKAEVLRYGTPDLVISSSPHPFVIFGARTIARKSNAKLCFEVRDLWPLTLVELGQMSPRHPFIKVMQWTENYAYRVSDRVVSLLSKACSHMTDHGMEADKFIHLPNGIDVWQWQHDVTPLPAIHREELHTLKQNGHFIVGYAGAHGLANALDSLLDAAALARKYPVSFVLVGHGPQKEFLQGKARKLGLTNVTFLPPVVKTSIPQLLAMADALFIGWEKKPLYRFGVSPNKLMDYMMAAKPIIHAIEAGGDLVAKSGCGISVPPANPEAIAGSIMRLAEMTAEERDEIGRRGREYVLAHHDYKVLATQFLERL